MPGPYTAVSVSELALRTSGPDDTRELAAAIAPLLRAGDVVALTGELGAGKTVFVQGAAAALGIERRITSPTFVLVRVYEEVEPPVVHADVYRLDRLHEVYDLGEDVGRADGITFVEWGDAISTLLPGDLLEVELLLQDADTDRAVRLCMHGRWQGRMPELHDAVARWAKAG